MVVPVVLAVMSEEEVCPLNHGKRETWKKPISPSDDGCAPGYLGTAKVDAQTQAHR